MLVKSALIENPASGETFDFLVPGRVLHIRPARWTKDNQEGYFDTHHNWHERYETVDGIEVFYAPDGDV